MLGEKSTANFSLCKLDLSLSCKVSQPQFHAIKAIKQATKLALRRKAITGKKENGKKMLELNLPKKSYNVGLWTFTGHLGALSFLGQGRAKFVWPRGHLRIKHRACMPMGPDMSLSKNHTTLMGVSRQLWKQTNKQTKKKTNPNIACYPFFFIQVFLW